MLRRNKSICLIGNGLNALTLAYRLDKCKNEKLCFLFLNQKDDTIRSFFYNSNIIEIGRVYSFSLNKNSIFFESLLQELNLNEKILECNKYSNNILYMDENGKEYKIGNYIFRILFSLLKNYYRNDKIHIDKNENLQTCLMKFFDNKTCKNIIFPYCYHYFCCTPNNILINSYFPQLKNHISTKRNFIRHLILDKENSFSSKNKKLFTFKGGNILLMNKLIEHLKFSDTIQMLDKKKEFLIKSEANKIKIFVGRKRIKNVEVVFCCNPLELKKIFKKSKIEYNKKKTLLKHLSHFQSAKITITNVCFKKNVLPFKYALESLLLVKENKNTNILSVLFDSNIFPLHIKTNTEQEETPSEVFKTSLRFLSIEHRPNEALKEVNDFLKNFLKIHDRPDLVVSNNYVIFLFNDKKDKVFKKIMKKYFKNVKIFWPFSFFKNYEFCLNEVENFCQTYLLCKDH